MKKLLILLLSVLSLTAFAQEKKTVAVLDPICRDNSVNPFFQQMVRGAMESAVTASSEYEAYDRSAFDQIQKEQAFQRTGAVNDSQIKKMGELAGVDYVLVSEVSAYEGYLATVIKILNVTTGKYDKSVDDYMQLEPAAVKSKCRELATSLFGTIERNRELQKGELILNEGKYIGDIKDGKPSGLGIVSSTGKQNPAIELMSYPTDTIQGNIVYRYTADGNIGLYRISKMFGCTQEDILNWNPKLRPRGILPGEEILIPTGITISK